MTRPGGVQVRHILVALDETAGGAAALETALELATAWGAELEAVFVEDANLLRLAALPFAREMGPGVAALRPLDAAVMERGLRGQAERLRRQLQARLQGAQLPGHFAVLRGVVARELAARARGADLVIVGRSGSGRGAPLGSIARALLAAADGAVLLAQPTARREPSVVVLFDGPAGARALELAIGLVRGRGEPLVVLVPSAQVSASSQVLEMAAQAGVAVEVRPIPAAEPRHVAAAARAAAGRLLVAPTSAEPVALAEAVHCPLLLAR